MKYSDRFFLLGDEWVYFKLFMGPKSLDDFISIDLHYIIEALETSNLIDEWFFIRYSYPSQHLRLRFKLKFPKNLGEVINIINPYFKEYLRNDKIWKIQTDTYKREIERYGEDNYLVTEQIFHHDSYLVSSFLNCIYKNEDYTIRWLFSLKALDTLLTAFNYNLKEKLNLLSKIKSGFAREFQLDHFLKKQIDKKYREYQEDIEGILEGGSFKVADNKIKIFLESYRLNISTLALQVNQDRPMLDKLLSNYMHMTMNRLFKSKNRIYELLCYDFLSRYYKSKYVKCQKGIYER